jgi:hypothetical protein
MRSAARCRLSRQSAATQKYRRRDVPSHIKRLAAVHPVEPLIMAPITVIAP